MIAIEPRAEPKPKGVTINCLRLKEARRQAGMTGAQLGGEAVSRAFIHQLETGKARPSPTTLAFLARRLGKPVQYFVDQGPPVVSTDLPVELIHSALASESRAECTSDATHREVYLMIASWLRSVHQLVTAIEQPDNFSSFEGAELGSAPSLDLP